MGLRRGKKSKKSDASPPMPDLPPPAGLPAPLPLPGAAPLPPLPGVPSPGEATVPAPLPAPLPAPAPQPATLATPVPLPAPVNDPETTLSGIAKDSGYNELWAKRSEKPLQQIYGHIDRISNKEAGSLLDRYADRFGHSLDREIIVMRKAAMEEKVAEIRDAPTVELIDDEPAEPVSELQQVEDELRALKPLYQEAKALGDKETLAELTPTLQALMARRKALKGGSAPSASTQVAETAEDDDGLFAQFVTIVDALLGDHLPESIVNDFIASADFAIYQEVAQSPNTADEDTRAAYYRMVDDQLGNMSPESISAFVESDDFAIYQTIGERYKDE
ncbi:MAG: hypothetical protein VW945_02350 [Candidatus Poseidoniales archaeon]